MNTITNVNSVFHARTSKYWLLLTVSVTLTTATIGYILIFCRSGKLPLFHRSQYFVQLKTFGAVGRTISGNRAYTAFLN